MTAARQEKRLYKAQIRAPLFALIAEIVFERSLVSPTRIRLTKF